MAVLDGMLTQVAEPGYVNPHLTHGMSAFQYLDYPLRDSIYDESKRTAFTVTSALPVTATAAHAVSGGIPISFFDDYYNRIHVRPAALNLGLVITEQTSVVDVWNAGMASVNLTAISGVDEGLSLVGPDAFPEVFGPIRMAAYTLSVTRDGPSTIESTITWTFSAYNNPQLPITGDRVLAWHFAPNWVSPLIERLGWMTDVLRSDDGSEQRAQLRTAPRLEYSFEFDVDGTLRRLLENKLHDLGAAYWALPVWPDGSLLTAAVTAGDLTLPVSTTLKDFEVDGLLLLLSPDGLSFEGAQIDAVDPASITLRRPLINSWDTTTLVYPARIARMPEPAQLRRLTGGYIVGTVSFLTETGAQRTYAAETPTYRSQPVLEHEPNWRDGVEFNYRRQLDVFDAMVGAQHVVDLSACAEPALDKTWTAFGRTEIDALRKFLYSRAGRHKGVWLPTFTPDIVPIAAIASSSVAWHVQACGLARHASGATNRRDIRIELTSGTVYYRRVVSAGTIDASTEAITIDSALGVTVEAADVYRISWMSFARLDSDDVELEWSSGEVVEARITLTSPRNDV